MPHSERLVVTRLSPIRSICLGMTARSKYDCSQLRGKPADDRSANNKNTCLKRKHQAVSDDSLATPGRTCRATDRINSLKWLVLAMRALGLLEKRDRRRRDRACRVGLLKMKTSPSHVEAGVDIILLLLKDIRDAEYLRSRFWPSTDNRKG
jgi:hypothetical protein